MQMYLKEEHASYLLAHDHTMPWDLPGGGAKPRDGKPRADGRSYESKTATKVETGWCKLEKCPHCTEVICGYCMWCDYRNHDKLKEMWDGERTRLGATEGAR